MVYPDIEDVYSLENSKVDWTLEYKKDLPLTQVIDYVRKGITPSNEERRGLPVRTNQMLRWLKYLYVEDGLLHLLKPDSTGPKGLERKLVDEAHRGSYRDNRNPGEITFTRIFPRDDRYGNFDCK